MLSYKKVCREGFALEKKHYLYFDYLRVFAMLCVVFMHSATAVLWIDPIGIGGNWLLVNCGTSLAFCAVPLFFMMSGYLLFSSPRTTDISHLLKKRIPKLVVPLIFWSGVAAAWLSFSGAGRIDIKGFLSLFGTAGSSSVMVHFWFMYTLIALYLISPFLYNGLNNLTSHGRLYLIILLALVVVLPTIHALVPTEIQKYLPSKVFTELALFSGHIVSFLLGSLLGKLERRIPNWLLILTAVADVAFITIMTYRITIEKNVYTQTFQSQSKAFEILLAACIFLLFKQNLDHPFGRLNKTLTPLASLTFPIYLMHNVGISIAAWLGIPRSNAVQVVLFTLGLTLFCYLVTKTAATIKPLCYIVTGLSYENACTSCNWVYTIQQIKSRTKQEITP